MPRDLDAPGLYELSPDGVGTPLITGACYLARYAGEDLLVSVVTAGGMVLGARRAGAWRWSCENGTSNTASDASHIAHSDGDGAVLLRRAGDGTVVWRVQPAQKPLDLWLNESVVHVMGIGLNEMRSRKDGALIATTEEPSGPAAAHDGRLLLHVGGNLVCLDLGPDHR